MLIEHRGSINNFAISKNTPSLPARCLESFQEKERKKIRSTERREHIEMCFYSGHKSLSTLALINWSSSNPLEFL